MAAEKVTKDSLTMAESLRLTVPSAKEQRAVIASLESEDESTHVYAVTKTWYETWRVYVGLNGSDRGSVLPPGELEMDTAVEDNNMYVDEKIWCQWAGWYGVCDSHELDRRNLASDEKDFEICMLTPYSGILENPAKTFDISEEVGYVELQLRRIFRVSPHRDSRLWACERSRNARFKLVLDRCKEICCSVIDSKKDYILALEVGNVDGSWASHNPGAPRGTFDKYSVLIGRPKPDGYWEKELTGTLDAIYGGITTELNETVSGIVKTTRCISAQRDRDLEYVKDKLETRTRGVEEVQKTLNKKAKDILAEEDQLKSDLRRLKRDRDHLDQERAKFHDEIKRMEETNKIAESKVKLNIGGLVHVTSTLTLVKDAGSMLAAMFSGRHSLTKDEDGAFFIDRDGTHFRFILNFLRDGGFREGTLPTDPTFLNELLTEAEFYQVSSLVKLLTDMLKGRSGKSAMDNGSDNEHSPRLDRKHHGSKRPHRKVAIIK